VRWSELSFRVSRSRSKKDVGDVDELAGDGSCIVMLCSERKGISHNTSIVLLNTAIILLSLQRRPTRRRSAQFYRA